jgi:hypothetical protein
MRKREGRISGCYKRPLTRILVKVKKICREKGVGDEGVMVEGQTVR